MMRPLLLLLVPAVALAHGGEDHGPPLAKAMASGHSAYLVTRDFELVATWAPQPAGHDLHLALYLADRVTNRPVTDAKIELELTGPAGKVPVTVEPGGMPGVYLGHLTPPADGSYGAVAQVTAGSRSDLLTADGLVLGPEPEPAQATETRLKIPWLRLGFGAGGLLILLGLVVLLRRRRAAAAVPAVVAVLALWPAVSWSHGGEDHGPPKVAEPTGGEGFVAKEVQFLLGLETAAVVKRPLRPTLEVLGTLVARPDRQAEVSAPQAGFLSPAPGGHIPLIGERVTRGQVLAVVEEAPGANDRVAVATGRIEAQGRLAQATARGQAARKKLARLKSLPGTVAEQEVLDAQGEVRLAATDRAEASRSLELFEEGVPEKRRFDIVAPIDGVLFKATATAGARTDPATPIFEIVDVGTVWIDARVFTRDVASLETADEAEVAVTGLPGVVLARRVTLGGAVDPTTRTLSVLFEAPNPTGLLRPGMLAEVRIGLGPAVETPTVREAAVVERDGVPGMYVKVDPEHFRFAPARLGRRSRDDREVQAGAAVGELVVVQAAGTLD